MKVSILVIVNLMCCCKCFKVQNYLFFNLLSNELLDIILTFRNIKNESLDMVIEKIYQLYFDTLHFEFYEITSQSIIISLELKINWNNSKSRH